MGDAPTAGGRLLAAIPQFTVPDVVETAEYYRDVLGFRITGYFGEPPVFAMVARDSVELFFNQAADETTPRHQVRAEAGFDAYLNVDDADGLAEELKLRGARIVEGPVDRVYKQRELVLEDCNGLRLALGQDISSEAG